MTLPGRTQTGTRLWLVGYALLLLAWVGGNPPGNAPDEPQHHIKAVGVAYGEPVGRAAEPIGDFPPSQRLFLEHVTRSVRIPAKLAPAGWACNAFRPAASSACTDETSPVPGDLNAWVEERTALGTYTPAPYVPFGLVARLVGRANEALYAERLLAACLCLALLGLALSMSSSAWSRLALLVAVTPTVIFMSASITTSGLELTAALAHGGSILSIAREPKKSVWWAYAISGSILAISRPLGPLWILAGVLLLLALKHPRVLLERLKAEGRSSGPALTLLTLTTMAGVVWTMAVMPHEHADLGLGRSLLAPSIRYLPDVLRQSVGAFGWLNVLPPLLLQRLGIALYCIVLAMALWRGRRYDRVLLLAALVGTVGLALYLSAFTQLPYAFYLQARYVMPASGVVLLLAGEMASRSASRRPRVAQEKIGWVTTWVLPSMVIFAVSTLQWTSWLVSAHRSAVGRSGTWLFFQRADWVPPGGWLLWLLTASAGCLAIALGAALSVLPGGVSLERLGRTNEKLERSRVSDISRPFSTQPGAAP